MPERSIQDVKYLVLKSCIDLGGRSRGRYTDLPCCSITCEGTDGLRLSQNVLLYHGQGGKIPGDHSRDSKAHWWHTDPDTSTFYSLL